MDFFWHLLAVSAIQLPVTLGVNLTFGRAKLLAFGHVGVSLVSAYATFLTLRATGSYALAVLAGMLAALLLSAVMAWLALRLEPDGLAVLTIAVHFILLAIVLNWTSVTRGALGLPGLPRPLGLDALPAYALLCLVVAGLWAWALSRFDRSRLGRQVTALAEHPAAAAALGIRRSHALLIVFLLAGLGSALSNVLYPPYIHLLHPNDYAFTAMLVAMTLVIAGRPGHVWGVTFATFGITFVREGLRFLSLPAAVLGPMRLLLFGSILLLAVWLRRATIFPVQRKL
jgi:ABC-type branched-subunit amino acid transport system permease subunit